MKEIAFEWHNETTGHCYVDYIPRNLMDENNGYTKTPLYKEEKILSIIGHDFEALIATEVERRIQENVLTYDEKTLNEIALIIDRHSTSAKFGLKKEDWIIAASAFIIEHLRSRLTENKQEGGDK